MQWEGSGDDNIFSENIIKNIGTKYNKVHRVWTNLDANL